MFAGRRECWLTHHHRLFACWPFEAGGQPKQRNPKDCTLSAPPCAHRRVTPMANRKRQLNVPVDDELAEAVHRAANRAYRSKASWIREALRQAAAS